MGKAWNAIKGVLSTCSFVAIGIVLVLPWIWESVGFRPDQFSDPFYSAGVTLFLQGSFFGSGIIASVIFALEAARAIERAFYRRKKVQQP
jgi:hypothetical protein